MAAVHAARLEELERDEVADGARERRAREAGPRESVSAEEGRALLEEHAQELHTAVAERSDVYVEGDERAARSVQVFTGRGH